MSRTTLIILLLPSPVFACADFAACEAGCRADAPRACHRLGEMYYTGIDAPVNGARAREAFRKACAGGIERACLQLGWMYYEGEGGAPDPAKAAERFTPLCDAKAKKTLGCVGLGLVYADRGAAKKAIDLLDPACHRADARACARLGRLLLDGKKRAARGARLIALACADDEPSACVALGSMKFVGRHGQKRDKRAALNLWARACDAGAGEGCLRIGDELAKHGRAEPAFDFFQRACEGDAQGGCVRAAALLRKGAEGVRRDAKRARQMLAIGCRLGHGPSCAAEAGVYRGRKGTANAFRAARLEGVACAAGHRPACKPPTPTVAAYAKKRAAGFAKTCPDKATACATLGDLRLSGLGVRRDRAAAAKLYDQACAGGHESACLRAALAR